MNLLIIADKSGEIVNNLNILCERYSNIHCIIAEDENDILLRKSEENTIIIYSPPKFSELSNEIASIAQGIIFNLSSSEDISRYTSLKYLIFSLEHYSCLRDVPKNVSFITCGMCEKDTISLSSNLVDNCVISIARSIKSICERIIDVCEFSINEALSTSGNQSILLAFGGAVCFDLIYVG